MGLFELPFPLLSWLDARLAVVAPALVRVVIWAALSAALSMWIYRRLSRQRALARLAAELSAVRQELTTYDGDFQGLKPRIGRMLRLSLRQVGLTFVPAIAASIPLLFVLPWLGSSLNEQVELVLPSATLLPWGPRWLHSAEVVYLAVLLLCSVAIRKAFRIR